MSLVLIPRRSFKRWRRFVAVSLLPLMWFAVSPGIPGAEHVSQPHVRLGLMGPAAPVAPAGLARHAVSQMPVRFEPNVGQGPRDALFVSRGRGSGMALGANFADFTIARAEPIRPAEFDRQGPGRKDRTARAIRDPLRATSQPIWPLRDRALAPTNLDHPPAARVRMSLVGSNTDPAIQGLDLLPGKSNYLAGDRRHSYTCIPNYGRVLYAGIYPGVDMVWHGRADASGIATGAGGAGDIEYDLVVKPGASPQRIDLAFEGATRIHLNSDGDLVIGTACGPLIERRPFAYQSVSGSLRTVDAAYEIDGNQVRFRIGSYDLARELIIDPAVGYSTFLGASGSNGASGFAVSPAGEVYISGPSDYDFPTTSGAFISDNQNQGVFVARFTADGKSLLYSTLITISNATLPSGMAIGPDGSAYVSGVTYDSVFPATSGPPQNSSSDDRGFVLKLSPAGDSLVYSKEFDAAEDVVPNAIAVDSAGEAYITGITYSANFQVTDGESFGTAGKDGTQRAFVRKLSSDGSSWLFSAAFNSTFGPYSEAIALDAQGDAFITGYADDGFPTSPGAYQTKSSSYLNPFVSKLSPDGKTLMYSTFIGGEAGDEGTAITVDSQGNAYVAGSTTSLRFPITSNAVQKKLAGGGAASNVFAAELNPDGTTLLYSTYLGGHGRDSAATIAVDAGGDIWLAGVADSADFPLRHAVQKFNGGGGVFKSTDAGKHWQLANSGIAASQVTTLAAAPGQPSELFAGTATSGLFVTVDGANTWKQVALPWFGSGGHISIVSSVAFSAADPRIVYVCADGVLFKSRDHGSTWTTLSAPASVASARFALADPKDARTVYAGLIDRTSTGHLYKSGDGGKSWEITALPSFDAFAATSLLIDPAHPSRLVFGNLLGVWTSSDGGVTWNATQGPGLQGALATDGQEPPTLYATDGSDVFRSADFGNTWIDLGNNSSYPELIGVFANPGDPTTIFAGTIGGFFELDSNYLYRSRELDRGLFCPYVNALVVSPDKSTLYAATGMGADDVFISELSPSRGLLFSTYYGGLGNEDPIGIGIDTAGNVYVGGSTESPNFRTTAGAFQPSFSPISADSPRFPGDANAFVLKLNGH